jgi:hypothetical protein
MTSITQGRFGYFSGSISRRASAAKRGQGGFLMIAASVALIAGGGAAYGGPCTAQIAQLKRQIASTVPGPESGPTAPQSVGAQLHHQPTPGTVQHAEHVANADADAAVAQAQVADANGNAAACKKSLDEAKRLYGID